MTTFIITYVIIGALITVTCAKESVQKLEDHIIPIRIVLSVYMTVTAPILLLIGIVIGFIKAFKH